MLRLQRKPNELARSQRRYEAPRTPYWALSPEAVLSQLTSTKQGLSEAEAARRTAVYGPNRLQPRKRTDVASLLLAQLGNPITAILIAASVLAFFLHDTTDATIVLAIVLASALLGFLQERGATRAVESLLAVVRVRVTLVRDGRETDIPTHDVVPGDIVVLRAGGLIPADGRLLESLDLFVDEAALTGETFPAEKAVDALAPQAALKERLNMVFMGTHVVSGAGLAVVTATGSETEFGAISHRLRLRPPETEFERGVRRFGYLLAEVTLLLALGIFAANMYFARSVLDSLLFSLALAVGLTPQLLPAVISVNLAHGARRMAARRVIIKRLASIENFGSMDILCSDKTGTLTEGVVTVQSTPGVDGGSSSRVLHYAQINAQLQTGFANPVDVALSRTPASDLSEYRKLDEVPYDFVRKRLSVLVERRGRRELITKGALAPLLTVCSHAEREDGQVVALPEVRERIEAIYRELSARGLRVLGVACRDFNGHDRIQKEDEVDLRFLGFLALFDPPKAGVAELLEQLRSLGVTLRIITGDNRLVAQETARRVGLAAPVVVTGSELRVMSDEALLQRVGDTDLFAEIEPNQKERLITAFRKGGHVVGYIGDGINDVSALHVADVGISVSTAVDAAKEAADVVLLEKDLGVVVQGIREGRATFANTLKYVFMATSANFGNMFSMAGASLLLPFLPLLPKQILFMNLLTDLPEMTIASDSVDSEAMQKPHRWSVRQIRRFMVTYGAVSSAFDFLAFGVLLFLFRASAAQFQTGWFVESVASAALIVLVLRTRRAFYRSRPSRYLLAATVGVVAAAAAVPFTPLGTLLGFQPLPIAFLPVIAGIVALYFVTAEATKRLFNRRSPP